jgi:hypothetical protein
MNRERREFLTDVGRGMFIATIGPTLAADLGLATAEKYYRTVTEEFAATRPAFRWRQVVGLARYAASAYGQAAPGHVEACRLLGV